MCNLASELLDSETRRDAAGTFPCTTSSCRTVRISESRSKTLPQLRLRFCVENFPTDAFNRFQILRVGTHEERFEYALFCTIYTLLGSSYFDAIISELAWAHNIFDCAVQRSTSLRQRLSRPIDNYMPRPLQQFIAALFSFNAISVAAPEMAFSFLFDCVSKTSRDIIVAPPPLLVLCYGFALAIYRLFFHPLSSIPGPWYAAITGWYEVYQDIVLDGNYTRTYPAIHAKYGTRSRSSALAILQLIEVGRGPVVRVTPHRVHVNDPDFFRE